MAIFQGKGKSARSSNTSNRAELSPAEVWYINFYLLRLNKNGREKVGNVIFSMKHANHASIIKKIQAGGAEKLQSFIDNVLTIKYTPGKGEYVETRFLNVLAKSTSGHTTEIGTIRLSESNPEHVSYILAYDKEPARAVEIFNHIEADFQSAEGVVHEYDF